MQHLRTLSLAVVAAATLAACGGGGGGGFVGGGGGAGDNAGTPAAPTVALQSGSAVPESAAGSVTGVVAFLLSLVTSDTAEPVTVGNATLATSETAEPEPVSP